VAFALLISPFGDAHPNTVFAVREVVENTVCCVPPLTSVHENVGGMPDEERAVSPKLSVNVVGLPAVKLMVLPFVSMYEKKGTRWGVVNVAERCKPPTEYTSIVPAVSEAETVYPVPSNTVAVNDGWLQSRYAIQDGN